MTKRLLFAILMLYSMVGYSFAQSASITPGVNWLVANQNADKSWGGGTSSATPFNTTAAAVSALKICGNTGSSASDGLNWLNGQTPDSVNFVADRLLTNAIAGLNTTGDFNQLIAWKNFIDGSWGLDGEYSNDISEIALTLQALHAANYSDYSTLFQAINFITSTQNSDGGWGSTSNGTSSAYVTARVLKALAAYNGVFLLQDSINKAVSFLLTKQNPDGGFGSSPSTVYDTASAFDALVASGTNIAAIAPSAINYLTSTQLADGSWDEDPYSTALALRALANVRANLVVASGDISLSKSMPQENEPITITATVHNTGFDSASGIVVRFFLGDPNAVGTQIGTDQVIPALSVGGAAQASITASFTGTGGKTIFVVVDPDNLISETTKADNKASARLWVATAPDLAVYSEDLKPSTYVPTPGTAFTLAYTVRNLGESPAGGFDIALYDGQPAGAPLQTAHISGLNGTEVRTGTFGVTLTGDGAHTPCVMAEATNQTKENIAHGAKKRETFLI